MAKATTPTKGGDGGPAEGPGPAPQAPPAGKPVAKRESEFLDIAGDHLAYHYAKAALPHLLAQPMLPATKREATKLLRLALAHLGE